MSLNNMMRAVFLVIGISVCFSLFAVFQLNGLANEVNTMADIRYRSYQAADELRQSSDDLTRLGRTYVVTGDEKYEKMYLDILDIRNGKKARPQNYHTIYWDLVLNYGQKPKPDGKQVALLDMMKELGFTDNEFGLLEDAAAASDGLVNMEVKAMNAVKGLFPDNSGQYTKTLAPDPDMAIKILHSQQYHIEKAKILAPINDFFQQLEARTKAQFGDALSSVKKMVLISNALLIFVLAVAAIGYLIVYKKITNPIMQMANQLNTSINNHDLTLRVDKFTSVELDKISSSINSLLKNYGSTINGVNKVSATIERISGSIEQISGSNIRLSSQQNEQLEMAATAMDEMNSALSNVAENTTIAESHAATTESAANTGNKTFSEATDEFKVLESEFERTANSISQLADESKNVGSVLEVIKGIAEQTNLLALNAAIEAARAGEQGRGFAVVADEVRSLAQRSQESTIEIETIISSLQAKASQATEIITHSSDKMKSTGKNIGTTSEALLEIKDSSVQIHLLNTTIASATEEQLQVSNEIADNLNNVKNLSNEITDITKGLGSIVNEMISGVDDLKGTVNHFKVN